MEDMPAYEKKSRFRGLWRTATNPAHLVCLASASILIALSVTPIRAAGSTLAESSRLRNGLVAFSTGKDIFVIRPDGKGLKRVTENGLHDRSPAWAPGGKRLSFSCRGTKQVDRDICLISPDGSKLRSLTRDETPDQTSSWSPDRRRLVFSRDTVSGSQIFVIDRDGENLAQLTHNPVSAFSPKWSLDGQRILFTGWGPTSTDIFTIRVDGTEETNLTMSSETESSGDWSPTGASIVFDRLIEGTGYRIFTSAADGTGVMPLGVAGNSPTWSPNGRRILATRLQGNFLRCFSIRTDGTGERHISPRIMDCYSPDWQSVSS